MTDVTSFDALLSRAIERRGLTLAGVCSRMSRAGHAVSVAMLSDWRRGVDRPPAGSLAVVEALERILNVQHGTFTGSLVEGLTGPVGPVEVDGAFGSEAALVSTSIHDTVVLDERGCQSAHVVRQCLTATAPGADRFRVGFRHDDPAAVMRPLARAGCTIGREIRSGGLYVVELILPRALGAGEAWATEFAVLTEGQAEPLVCWERTVAVPVRFLHFSIVFDGPRVPADAELLLDGRPYGRLAAVGTTLEAHLQDVGPATATVTWQA